MHSSYLVSVVVPCLNRADFLAATLESILRQDYPRIECIVVDGGSTDATLDILRRYNGRIKWISEPDRGPPDAINKGWRLSNGEILAWLNADDLWAEGAVSNIMTYLAEHPDVDVVYGNCGILDKDGRHMSTAYAREWNLEYALTYCDHVIHQAASFMRRAILERVGWLYPKLCHDHELWLRIGIAGGRIQHIPSLLGYARHHAGNLGYRSDLVIPLKIDLTKNLFANPALPDRLHNIRDRAVSNAYLRGIDYLFLDEFSWRRDVFRIFGLIGDALRTDPSNVSGVIKYVVRTADSMTALILKRCLPDWAYQGLRAAKRAVWEALSAGTLARIKGP